MPGERRGPLRVAGWGHRYRSLLIALTTTAGLVLVSYGALEASGLGSRVVAHLSTLAGIAAPVRYGSLSAAPIKHIVLLLEENRSFDSLFGQFPGADGSITGTVAFGGHSYTFPLVPASYYSWHDIGHGDHDAIVSIDNGKMDGFVREAFSDLFGEKAAYQQQSQADIPNLYALAHAFTLSDRTFSPEPGSTFVNHLYMVAGQDGHAVGNPANPRNDVQAWGCDSVPGTYVQIRQANGQLGKTFPCFSFPTLADRLNQAHISWSYYAAPPTDLGYVFSTLDAFRQIRQTSQWTQHVRDERSFEADARAGRLPAFSWVTPRMADSMHPPLAVCPGESWLVRKLNAIMSGPDWKNTLVIVTWDEWGGYYDHVAPPTRAGGTYGPRVPLLLISPYARPGYVTHTVYSLESVLKTVEVLWGVAPLTSADRQSNDVLDSLDFKQKPNPPLILTPRACPAPLTFQQFRGYLDWGLQQAMTNTLGLSLARIESLHKTQTLAQIAQAQKVDMAALVAGMKAVAEAWAEGQIILQFIQPKQVDAEVNRTYAIVDRLVASPPGTPFFPTS